MNTTKSEFLEDCPSCQNTAPQRVVHTRSYGSFQQLLLTECSTCSMASLWTISYEDSPCLQWPARKALGDEVPKRVRQLYKETQSIRSKSPSSALILLGRALEAICADKGAAGRTLFDKIQALGQFGLPDVYINIAQGIRFFRNLGAHDGIVDSSFQHLVLVEDLFAAIVENIYTVPLKLKLLEYEVACVKKIRRVFGQWAVTDDGICRCDRDGHGDDYLIEKDRLMDKTWIAHLLGKNWCNIADFCDALYFARQEFELGNHNRDQSYYLREPVWSDRDHPTSEILVDAHDLNAIHQFWHEEVE